MTHHYAATASWTGSTGAGYEAYDRAHVVNGVRMSADPAFRGSASLPNPEELLLAAAVSCQLLSFLAVAARARIDVVAYEDSASAEMPEDWVSTMVLRPRITVVRGADGRPSEERMRELVQVAHRECFIARSLRTAITLEPTFEWIS